MQLQSTFGAFLVAFTMVHGAPVIAQAYQNPALWGMEQDAGLNPTDNLPIVDKHSKPSIDNLGALGMAKTIARDTKKSPPPKGKSNELAKAKSAEAGRKTVAGLKSILDDKLEKDSKDEKAPEGCNGGAKKDEEDKEKEDADDDGEKSGDEDAVKAPVKRSRRSRGGRRRPGSGPSRLKDLDRLPVMDIPMPPADIWYGTDEAAAAQDGSAPQNAAATPPAKRARRRSDEPRPDFGPDEVKDVYRRPAWDTHRPYKLWHVTDEATTTTNNNEKRSGDTPAPAPEEAEGKPAVDHKNTYLDRMPDISHRPFCRGKPGICSWGLQDQQSVRPDAVDDLLTNTHAPLTEDPSVLAVEPDLTVAGGGAVQKRQKGKGKGPSRSPSSSPSSGGGSSSKAPPSTGAGSTAPATPNKTGPKTDQPAAAPPAPAQQAPAPGAPGAPGSTTSGGGFTQGAKEKAKEIGQDVVTDTTTGVIVAGFEQAIAPAQPTETVVVQAPAEAAPAPEELAAAPVPAEAAAPVRRRAVAFSA